MSLLTGARVLLLFAIVAYFSHSYFHGTMDFAFYRSRMAMPLTKSFSKYLYINSFFMFVLCTLVFIFTIVCESLLFDSPAIDRSVLAVSLILAAGAIRLITLPNIGHWRRRAQ